MRTLLPQPRSPATDRPTQIHRCADLRAIAAIQINGRIGLVDQLCQCFGYGLRNTGAEETVEAVIANQADYTQNGIEEHRNAIRMVPTKGDNESTTSIDDSG